jgi:hypothetical protein
VIRNCLLLVLALSTGVPFWFDVPITILSAVLSCSASFLAFGFDLFAEIIRRRQYVFREFRQLPSSDNLENQTEDDSAADPQSRTSLTLDESQTSSTRAELEALLGGLNESNDILGDSWAKKYLITRLLWTFWYSCTLDRVTKGFFLGTVFVAMHYSGSISPSQNRY